jgi:hypothetical protein
MFAAGHDCFGSILVIEGDKVRFICEECSKAHMIMTKRGIANISPHSSDKHKNLTPLAAVKIAIGYVEKMK